MRRSFLSPLRALRVHQDAGSVEGSASTLFCGAVSDDCLRKFSNSHSSTSPSPCDALRLPASLPSFLIFGANTGVGKTLISAGLSSAVTRAKEPLLYIKPVQTGFPTDSDGALVARAAGAPHRLGPHAASLDPHQSTRTPPTSPGPHPTDAATLFAWAAPMSPHMTVRSEGRAVSDRDLRLAVASELRAFAARLPPSALPSALALVETAGGVCSPAPSGRLAADTFRPFRLPTILVADGRLGGISTSISALESLLLRGYDTAAVALLEEDRKLGNAEALERYLSDRGIPVIRLPEIGPNSGVVGSRGLERNLEAWLDRSGGAFDEMREALRGFHRDLREARAAAPSKASQLFWWPFTQHQTVDPGRVTNIDSRCGDDFLVYEPSSPSSSPSPSPTGPDVPTASLRPLFDGCASWWTQGLSAEHHPTLARGLAYAAGRYGHVMFPENTHGAALQGAERLLGTVGTGWASRVFWSDDGSTAVEIALKMAFRKALRDAERRTGKSAEELLAGGPELLDVHVIGLTNAYHGDTLGAMDAVPPSVFNRTQFPAWYRGRGLFFDPPTAGLVDGEWRVGERSFGADRAALFDWRSRDGSDLGATYRQQIRGRIDAHLEAHGGGDRMAFGALIFEPIVQGAGGMVFVDPLFQRVLVQEARARGIPVIFDEVFTGLYRLGVSSAWRLLGETPDIACYAKLLTGGSVPLAATVTSEAMFDLFRDPSKLNALLHGHSYSAHALGCQAASLSLSLLSNPTTNPNFTPRDATPTTTTPSPAASTPPLSAACPHRTQTGTCTSKPSDPGFALPFCACRAAEGTVTDLWSASKVAELSRLPAVARALSMGTVAAFELRVGGSGGGYASTGAAGVVRALREVGGVYARPLGNVVYLMASPLTPRDRCEEILSALETILREGSGSAVDGKAAAMPEDLVP